MAMSGAMCDQTKREESKWQVGLILGGLGSEHVQKLAFGRKEELKGGKWEWKHLLVRKDQEKEEQR